MPPVNIEEFYEADERRRDSEELELGSEWRDAAGRRFDLSYVVDTGELYLMSAPEGEAYEDPFGDIGVMPEQVAALRVEVLGTMPSVDDVHQALAGWEQAMGQPDSVGWLRERVAGAVRS